MLKYVVLISTSDIALLSELRDVRPVILSQAAEDMTMAAPMTARERQVLGPLLAVFKFFIRFICGQMSSHKRLDVFERNIELSRPFPPNRKARRYWTRYPTESHIPASCRYHVFRRLFPRDISRARFNELYARHGNWSRVMILGLRRWKHRKFHTRTRIFAGFSVLVSGLFTPVTASTSDGLWAVQMPPN